MIRPGVRIRVSVPATSANLGPGFDSLGLAVDLCDDYEVETTAAPGVVVESRGEGAASLPTGADHLVARAMLAAMDRFGVESAGLVLRCTNVIPQSRGLGSSAAAIVGGVLLGAGLAGGADTASIVALASEIEGHPDNVAAAVLGGLTISWTEAGVGRAVGLAVLPGVTPVVFVPETSGPTAAARQALPDSVAHGDAAFNAGRAALMVAALTQDPRLLLPATDDRLHQRQRRSTYPESLSLVESLREADWPAAISGAGPTVVVLAPDPVSADRLSGQEFPGFATRRLSIGGGAVATRVADRPM